MGLRYRIPFKDFDNNEYVVEVYREYYQGTATELRGATSCFVVSGTDEDFIYTPIRTTTATINVLDSELLLDLYSINNQYAPVKLYKNGSLEWTGYIKPEQFTQPYTPTPQSIGVECVSAISTLENIEYKPFSVSGNVTLWELIKTLVSKAKGGYKGIYIPNVYGKTSAVDIEVLKEITLIENNFKSEEMNCLEVMEAVCKFLNWTLFDIGGYLYFVDSDWQGEYRLYNEAMTSYSTVQGNSVVVQDIGFNGSGSNTLDVVHGYNKASVKALNHVFDDVVKDEPYDILKPYANGGYYTGTYSSGGEAHGVRKQFLKPMFWNVIAYTDDILHEQIPQEELAMKSAQGLNNVFGAVLMREADYECKSLSDETPTEDVNEFNYIDSVQIRVATTSTAQLNTMGTYPALIMKGEYAVYADCAISVDFKLDAFFDDDMLAPSAFNNNIVTMTVSCGDKYYNGENWQNSHVSFTVELDENGRVKSNRTPYTPYKIGGYLIPMDFFVGQPQITIYCPISSGLVGTKIRDLKFGYAKKDGIVEEGENGDRVYENVVNEAYMSACDEIEFDISSYNNDGATYSKALLGEGWLTNNLYCKVVDAMIRPEELLIRRIVNRYSETKVKLTESLKMTGEITPLTTVYDKSMVNKRFKVTSGEWDYQQNKLVVQIQEDAE